MYKSKYIILILSVLLFACNDLDISDDQAKSFIKFLSPSKSNVGKDVKQCGDGYIVLATVTSEKLNTEIVLYKIDQFGNIKIDGVDTLSSVRGGNNSASKLLLTSDGGFIVTGTVEDTAILTTDVYIEKFNSSFISEWSQVVGTNDNEECGSISVDYSGYIIVGSTDADAVAANGNPQGNKDFYLIKLDEAGNVEWTENQGSPGDDYASDVVAIVGGYLLVGTTNGLHGGPDNDIVIMQTNYVGGVPDVITYGGDNNDYGTSIIKANDGGYLIVGAVENIAGTNLDIYAVRVDSVIHDKIWDDQFARETWAQGYEVIKNNGGFIIVGSVEEATGTAAYFLKLEADSLGTKQVVQTYGGYGQIIYAIEQTYDGGYIMTGSSGQEGNEKIYLIKVNSEGEL
ncbi:hypothetical protein ACFLSE_05255 [Bacteroidota bacterium]